MINNELCLLLGDQVAGRVTRLSGGKLVFEYDPAYAADSRATPISVSMPIRVTTHTDSHITPWLWGLLPDSDEVLNRWSQTFQVSSRSPFSLLSTPLGLDCPGNIRLVPPNQLPAVGGEPDLSDVKWLTEAQVAQRLRDLTRDRTAWLGAKNSGRFSLAGAQAKTALLLDGGRWGEPQGATATSHILKPAIKGLDDHDLNEHLCLTAMSAAGMVAVRSTVERFEDQSAIVISRYDRLVRSRHQLRVHQEDLCQALGVHPARKYQNDGGPGPKDIADLFRRVMPWQEAVDNTMILLDALIWNWIIAGTDGHAKNYSLLLMGDQIRFAPFYDVASALPYATIPEQKMRLAMKFGGSYLVNSGSRPWARLASDLQLPEGTIRRRAARLVSLAPRAFAHAATDPAVVRLGSSLPQRLADLITKRAARCERYLAA
jgi:serine/threonine-protein kinase HipA